MSNGINTANESLPHESQTGSSLQPQSSATFVSSFSPVQLQSTEDLRTWLRQDSHANHSAQQENDSAQMIRETCGPQRGTLFATFDPALSCWKTCQASLLADTPESLLPDWPTWGMWANGAAYQLPTLAPPICDSDGGLWPTPRKSKIAATASMQTVGNVADPKGNLEEAVFSATYRLGQAIPRTYLNPEWVEWLMGWPHRWTALEPVGTDKFREWLRQHGNF